MVWDYIKTDESPADVASKGIKNQRSLNIINYGGMDRKF